MREQGYKVMICNAEELYRLSRIVNLCDGSGSSKKAFYLSADMVLGNHIEYASMSRQNKLFMPIGSDNNVSHYTGHFDGQGFEIRDLYFETSDTYPYYAIGLFAVIGKGGSVSNVGLYHPTINNATMTAVVGGICAINRGTVTDSYVICDEYDHVEHTNNIITDHASATAGLVAQNTAAGVIQSCYTAVRFHASDCMMLHPVCADNQGSISNCYYDTDLYATRDEEVTVPDTVNMKPVSNSALKRPSYYNIMQGTKFKQLRAGYRQDYINQYDTAQQKWQYPRLYGLEGRGEYESEPFIITTPAQLISLPSTYEYYSNRQRYYFRLGACIDMTEAAPNAYQPQMNYTIVTNRITSGGAVKVEYHAANESDPELHAYPFSNNVFDGAATGGHHCPFHHLPAGTDENGNSLPECHMIYHLTIDTPAVSSYSDWHSALGDEWYYTGLFAAASNSTITNLMLIGGQVSTGSHDLLKSNDKYNYFEYNEAALYVFNSSLCGYAVGGLSLKNVHSSVDLSLGRGRQFAAAMGSLVAGGNTQTVKYCSNSGHLFGGYKEFDEHPNITIIYGIVDYL